MNIDRIAPDMYATIANMRTNAQEVVKNALKKFIIHQNIQMAKKINSPLLFGSVGDDDTIKIREVISCRDCQMNLFE